MVASPSAAETRTRRLHDEGRFPATSAGLDQVHAYVRSLAGDAAGAQAVADTAVILAANAIQHTTADVLIVQIAVMPGRWQVRVDDNCNEGQPYLRHAKPGEPLHGLAAIEAAGIDWTSLGGGVLAKVPCPPNDGAEAILADAAHRAADAVS